MKKALNVVKQLDTIATGVFLILVFVDVMLQVITRITPNTIAVQWTVEMGSMLLCAMLWVGLGPGIQHNAHIRFTMITGLFPKKVQKVFDIFSDLVFMAFCIILAYYTLTMLQFYADHGTSTTILRWGKQWTKAPMFIGLVIATIRLAYAALNTIVHFNTSETTEEKGEN